MAAIKGHSTALPGHGFAALGRGRRWDAPQGVFGKEQWLLSGAVLGADFSDLALRQDGHVFVSAAASGASWHKTPDYLRHAARKQHFAA
ncbi:hypothetical protein [Cypionkella sp. TWP1-2-1b2]|uniref:hypothetical protein n=1 Tax=Cypionkella sp. TWP1-2-1b2 TaxID=2804675 RepID=UPI003CF16E22